MTRHPIAPGTYYRVFALLIGLTFLTVGVSFLHLGGAWHLAAGLAIAVVKAALVVLFFMHVLHSTRLTWVVVASGFFWLGIMLVLTLTDYLSRGAIDVPGK